MSIDCFDLAVASFKLNVDFKSPEDQVELAFALKKLSKSFVV